MTEQADKAITPESWYIKRERSSYPSYRGQVIGPEHATGEVLFHAHGVAWRIQVEGRTDHLVKALLCLRGDGGALTFNFAPDPRCTWHKCTARATTERTQFGGAVAPLCSTHNAEGDRLGYWLPQ